MSTLHTLLLKRLCIKVLLRSPPVFCCTTSLWKQCLNLFVFQRGYTYIYIKRNFYMFTRHIPRSRWCCKDARVQIGKTLSDFTCFCWRCPVLSVMSLCKLFPEASVLPFSERRNDLFVKAFQMTDLMIETLQSPAGDHLAGNL